MDDSRASILGNSDDAPCGYWCVVCGRFLPSDGGVIVHDDKPHMESMTFDEEDRPQ